MTRARQTSWHQSWVARGACVLGAFVALLAQAPPAKAHWPSPPESDGVYGRLGGNTDLSLKLGGLLSQSQFSGSVGFSAHYYSLVGATLDYSESLSGDAATLRSFSVGTELRPLFLPRWLLGSERGPAWLDLMLDSVCVGFGAYFAQESPPRDNRRGVWLSLGLGVPLMGRADGPWIEVRELRRWPDRESDDVEAQNALLVYVSWHELLQIGHSH